MPEEGKLSGKEFNFKVTNESDTAEQAQKPQAPFKFERISCYQALKLRRIVVEESFEI